MRKALLLSATLASLALALGACERRQEMVAADAPPELPTGAVDAVNAATRPDAFALPDNRPARGAAPPSSL